MKMCERRKLFGHRRHNQSGCQFRHQDRLNFRSFSEPPPRYPSNDQENQHDKDHGTSPSHECGTMTDRHHFRELFPRPNFHHRFEKHHHGPNRHRCHHHHDDESENHHHHHRGGFRKHHHGPGNHFHHGPKKHQREPSSHHHHHC